MIGRGAATRAVGHGSGQLSSPSSAVRGTRPRFRLEGGALALSGVLFVAKALLELKVGEPPSSGPELLVWRSRQTSWLAMTNEVAFFAVVLLVPGVIGLYSSLAGRRSRAAAWGCGLLAALIPVMMMLTIVHGRLSFPVYDISLNDPAGLQLTVSLYYGGQHAVGLVFCVATALLALALRKPPHGRTLGVLGVAVAVWGVVGTYPWLVGPGLSAASAVPLAGWFVAAGASLATSDSRPGAPVLAGD